MIATGERTTRATARRALQKTLAALCVVALPVTAQAAAGRIEVRQGQCGSGVRLIATDAKLSEVLARLSEALRFELEFKAVSDPVINVDVTRRAPELISKLAPSENIIVSQEADPRCPRERRVAKVWVLPNANAAPATSTSKSASAAPPSPDQERKDRMMKLRKELEDAYLKKHGVPEPSVEEQIKN